MRRSPHICALTSTARGTGRPCDQSDEESETTVGRIVDGGRRFKDNVLAGFLAAGVDIRNPFEMLLAIRRVGSKRLEELFGPGRPTPGRLRGRTQIPCVP